MKITQYMLSPREVFARLVYIAGLYFLYCLLRVGANTIFLNYYATEYQLTPEQRQQLVEEHSCD